jgi:hypothetical protein
MEIKYLKGNHIPCPHPCPAQRYKRAKLGMPKAYLIHPRHSMQKSISSLRVCPRSENFRDILEIASINSSKP